MMEEEVMIPTDPTATNRVDDEDYQRAKAAADAEAAARYRATHGADGYGLGSLRYPDNRQGRRAMARTWKRKRMTTTPESAIEAAAKALDDDEVNVWATSSDRAARIAVAAAAPEIARAATALDLVCFLEWLDSPHGRDDLGIRFDGSLPITHEDVAREYLAAEASR